MLVLDSFDCTESIEDEEDEFEIFSLSCFKKRMNLRLFVDSAVGVSDMLVVCATVASRLLDLLRKTNNLGIRSGSPRASEMVVDKFNGVSV